MSKPIPADVKAAIEELAIGFVDGAYRRYEIVGGKEPCVSVGLVTDYLRQCSMPEPFRYATKDRQRTWTRSTLEALRRRGKLGSSTGVVGRCYEPVRAEKKSVAQLDVEIAAALAK